MGSRLLFFDPSLLQEMFFVLSFALNHQFLLLVLYMNFVDLLAVKVVYLIVKHSL